MRYHSHFSRLMEQTAYSDDEGNSLHGTQDGGETGLFPGNTQPLFSGMADIRTCSCRNNEEKTGSRTPVSSPLLVSISPALGQCTPTSVSSSLGYFDSSSHSLA